MAASYPATPAPPAPQRRRSTSVVVPLLLILLGVVFLLRNVGVLPPAVWPALIRLWPVILILFGIEMLFGGRLGWLGQLIVALIVLAAGAWLLVWVGLLSTAVVGTTSHSFSQTLQGATQATARLTFGAGRVELGALDRGGDQLVSATFQGPIDLQPETRYRVRSGVGDFAYALNGGVRWLPAPVFGEAPSSLDMRFSPDVPLTLDVRTGASDARLDLSALRVSSLTLETGASSTWLRLPEATGTTTAHLRSGAASLAIEVPPGVAAQIQYQGGVSNLSVDEARFPLISESSRPGAPRPQPAPPSNSVVPPVPPAPPAFLAGSRLYRSADYDTAPNKVDLTIESGASSITIR